MNIPHRDPRNKDCEKLADEAASAIRKKLQIPQGETPRIGLILGTGWGDTLAIETPAGRPKSIPFAEASEAFSTLQVLEGHARKIAYGYVHLEGYRHVPVVLLRGRVHMNETPGSISTLLQVRLQVEMLIHLGVRRLILTCAAGGLKKEIQKGDLIAIDGFFGELVPVKPLFAGEFATADKAIDRELMKLALCAPPQCLPHRIFKGGHAIVRGPDFEGPYGKAFLAGIHPNLLSIGMSIIPEALIAELYHDDGVRVLPFANITDGVSDDCTHEGNQAAAKAVSAQLGSFLRYIIEAVNNKAS